MQSAVGYIWLAPERANDEAGLQAEIEAMRVYCQANSMALADVRVEQGTNGSALERPVLQEMLANKEATIIIPNLSALGRRFHDVATVLSEINYLNLRLISAAEDIDTTRAEGQAMLKVFISIPQVAKFMRVNEEGEQRVYVRSREVLHNGGTCPYGYNLNESTNQFQVVPLEANVVRRIFRERIAGRSLRQIANDLTRDGIPTKRGGRWQANTVKTILENIFYTGAYQCQNRIYQNDHEAIVGKELFEQVNNASEVVQMMA